MEQPNAPARTGCHRAMAAAAALILSCQLQPAAASPPEFRGTPWSEAARPHGLEPALLYALTLVESRHRVGPDRVAPWPWTIHSPAGGRWFDTHAEARSALAAMLERWPRKRIDIGAAQVNIGWHHEQVTEPERLLELDYNLKVAARILARAVGSTTDPVLGVGRYHAWVDETRARAYGRQVWRMYRDVILGKRDPVGRYVLGPGTASPTSGQRLAEQ